MVKRFMHTATVTLRLPLDIASDDEMAALRCAGIPVDALGNAESGYLFVRLGNRRCNIFRWFAVTPDPKAPWA
ncbi:hypothetical protein A3K87_31760 [Variovorax paradoxus]|uniref:Uncharacterized protein n=1 Tax=Variovorax paradoxus TaxID=34073 RepID=A0AA91I7H1_VARPD|nr:hypothetical protein [Variovorax paradoxus]OAK55364.1 hypothetical protein A3K87_31760 [Variovorax paradoxus]